MSRIRAIIDASQLNQSSERKLRSVSDLFRIGLGAVSADASASAQRFKYHDEVLRPASFTVQVQLDAREMESFERLTAVNNWGRIDAAAMVLMSAFEFVGFALAKPIPPPKQNSSGGNPTRESKEGAVQPNKEAP